MEKNKRIHFSKKISVYRLPANQQKMSVQREFYENRLIKIFSSPPSHLGYKYDIESLINELGLNNDEILYFTISSLLKIVRNKNEINIIASYLYLMPNIIKLLKGKDTDKKEQDILKDLLNLSQSMAYEKYQTDSILMKFGDKGITAYVILDGQVDVLVKSFKKMNITKKDYLFYLANLLKYNEYGLLNEAINENFSVFPLEVYDGTKIKEIKISNINDNSLNNDDLDSGILNNLKESSKTIKKDNIKFSEEKTKNNDDNHNSSSNSLFRLNEENEQMKEFKSVFKISSNKLLKMFNLRQIDKKNRILSFCSLNDYIKRIELIPDNYKNYLTEDINIDITSNNNEKDKEKRNENNKVNNDIDNESEEENKLYNLKIFNYKKVATLGKGALFGEIALRDANSLRTGTLITSSECHCSVLNKKTFDNCLKKGAEKYMKELLTFFVNLPIFMGLSETLFYHKYYTNLSKKIMLRGNLIITQGEKPKNIILIQTGSYGLTTRISLFDLTKLILHFIKENLKNKNNINSLYDEEVNKYNRLLKKTNILISKAKSLMNENIKFKKFYLSEIFIRVTELSCPDMVGYKEYVDENGLYAFSIESKSPENVIFTLDNKFYSELQQKNYMVRNNQKELLEKKINAIIQRLFIIRNSYVNSFFDDKGEKEIGSLVLKELENLSNSKLKQKRFLKFKSIEYKINKKTLEEEKNKHKSHKNKYKYKKIKNVSRNKKINKNLGFYNSFNQRESKKNNDIKHINGTYNINNNKLSYNYKQSGKMLNLYKSSNDLLSSKKDHEDLKIIKKKNILESQLKEKNESFNRTLKNCNSKNKLDPKNNTENNSKINFEIKFNKTEKTSLLNTPKINSACISDRNNEIRDILLNSLVWEEIKNKFNKKIKYNKDFINKLSLTQRNKKHISIFEKSYSSRKLNNEEMNSPFNSFRNSNDKIIVKNKNTNKNISIHFTNSPKSLHRSLSEISLNKNLKTKTRSMINEISSPKYIYNYNKSKKFVKTGINNDIINNYASLRKHLVPKINLKIKRLFSPQEIKLIREIKEKRNDINIINYHQNKFEKYKLERKFYYNNLRNRMKLFYNIEKK